MAKEFLDPVCGMKVDPDRSSYQFHTENKYYFFCSKHCLDNFKQNPKKYLQKDLKDTPSHILAEHICPMHPEVIQQGPGNCPICGMALEPKTFEINQHEDPEYKNMLRRFWIGTFFAIPVLFLGMSMLFPLIDRIVPSNLSRWLQFLLSTPVVLWAGYPFFEKGWQSLIYRRLNMFSLISLGVGTAYIYSVIAFFFPRFFPNIFLHQGEVPLYFETAAMITVLVLLGQVLELKARGKTNQAIKALLSRAAKTAHIVEDGIDREIPINEVRVGDILHVRPGDKIPVDGSVIEGKSFVDESMVSGEPMPVEKVVNTPVIGGSINMQGSFLMQAEKVGNETLLSRIIHMVSEAQRSRAPIQRLADSISNSFVPAVIFVAALTFITWTWIGPEPSSIYGLLNAVAVLIIACPCALGLATPMSIMVGIGKGAEAGILIKNAEALEKLKKIKTVIIDKTGTLTEGKPKITRIISLDKGNEAEILRWAAAVEQHSEHPLATAIVQEAKKKSIPLTKVDGFQSYTGGGVFGRMEDRSVLVGNKNLFEEKKINGIAALLQQAQELQASAQTAVFVAIGGKAAGLIAVSDPIKTSTPQAVAELHKLGLHIVILSGDNEHTVQSVAKTLGIDEAHANVTPGKKQQFVQQIKSKMGLIAMAGDGINDAPALAAADVGIAMGTGTDVAIESADITLMKGDLMGIARAIRLSHAMMKNVHQNLFFAFIYNAFGIPIAAGLLYPFTGLLLNPIIAALAMSLSSVSVIMNSLRLRITK